MARIDLDLNNTDLIYDDDAIDKNLNKKLCSGYGQYHSPINKTKPQEYITITLSDIISMVKNPQSIDKEKAQWFIPSTLKSRVHKEQRDNGKFYALWADIDEIGDILFYEISQSIKSILPPETFIICYTSSSATPIKQKSRIIIPLKEAVSGVEFNILQIILNDKLQELGITPDRTAERYGQICFMPNKGIIDHKKERFEIFYQSEIAGQEDQLFNHSLCWNREIEQHKERLKIEAEEQKARQERARQQVQDRIDSGELNPVQAYKDAYPIETALSMYGYKRYSQKWLSPNSESGQAGVIVKDGKWISSHGSDANIGKAYKGGTWGDAFDLFVYYDCHNDIERAVVEAGNMFYIDGKTINKHKQIEYKKNEERILFEQNERQQAKTAAEPPIDYSNPEHWEDPEPIEQKLLPVESLPDEAIPTPFKGWIYDISKRWSVPLDFPFISTLIVASSIIGTGATVRPKKCDDWTVFPNLWGGIIGDPSVMKSPVLTEIVGKSIGRLEVDASNKFQQKIKEFKTDKTIFDLTLETKKTKIKKALKDGDDISSLKQELEELNKNIMDSPTEQRFLVNDCTIEKFVELNRANPRGLLFYRDELIGFFKKLDKDGNESDRAFVLEAWNGNGKYTQDRIARGTVSTNLCMSLIGGIQPDKITDYLLNAINGDNDGFVQRLQLMVYPDKNKWKFVDEYPNTEAKNNFYRIIEKLAAMQEDDFIQAGATMPEGEKIPCFKFDDDAYELFKEWITTLQAKIENPDDHNIIKEHLTKYRSLMPSLALIYHLIEIADKGYIKYEGKYINGGKIPLHCTRQAIRCTEYLEKHARRIYSMAIKSADTCAKNLAEKIIKKNVKEPFTTRDIYRKGWSSLNTNELAQQAIDYLIESDWLKSEEATKGKRKYTQYLINPKVFTLDI